MYSCLVLAASLVVAARAFAPARIQWGGLPARKFVLAPQANPGIGLVLPQNLIIRDALDSAVPDAIPEFTAQLDQTITWDTQKQPSVRWCIEASGNRIGDVARINHCTGETNQKWNWVPNGRGQNMIQLYGSDKCLHVAAGNGGFLHGAPVGLHECGNQITEEWNFEEPISSVVGGPIQRLQSASSMRHLVICVFSLIALGMISVGAWSHGRESKANARVVGVQGTTSPNTHQGGVSLSLPLQSGGTNTPTASPAVMILSPSPLASDDGMQDAGLAKESSLSVMASRATMSRRSVISTVLAAAPLVGVRDPVYAESEEETYIKELRQDVIALEPLQALLDEGKWDEVRSVLKTPPVVNLWNLGPKKNVLRSLGLLREDDDMLEAFEDVAGALQLADQYTYDNNFIYFQPGNGKVKVKEPKQQLGVAQSRLKAVLERVK